jgi:hypothetical protein
MSDKSRDDWPEAIAKRITMCSTNIPGRTQMQLINSGRVQRTYLEKPRLFNQILGSRNRIAQKRLVGNPDLPAI